jgi:hypothetical protein
MLPPQGTTSSKASDAPEHEVQVTESPCTQFTNLTSSLTPSLSHQCPNYEQPWQLYLQRSLDPTSCHCTSLSLPPTPIQAFHHGYGMSSMWPPGGPFKRGHTDVVPAPYSPGTSRNHLSPVKSSLPPWHTQPSAATPFSLLQPPWPSPWSLTQRGPHPPKGSFTVS